MVENTKGQYMSKKRLTTKQLKYIKGKVEGKTGVDAVIDAGYNVQDHDSAKSIATQNNDNPLIARAIDKALKARGLDEHKIAEVIAEGLEAKITFYDKEAGELRTTNLPAHGIRHKFLNTLIDINGAKSPTQHEVRGVLAITTLNQIKQKLKLT